jgi:hypothetical protein
LGKEHVDVRHGFHKRGALAPRNRSTNQRGIIRLTRVNRIIPNQNAQHPSWGIHRCYSTNF